MTGVQTCALPIFFRCIRKNPVRKPKTAESAEPVKAAKSAKTARKPRASKSAKTAKTAKAASADKPVKKRPGRKKKVQTEEE